MNPLPRLFRWLTGCTHAHLSRPFTEVNQKTGRRRTYKVCLDCTEQFAYDLAEMRITGPLDGQPERPVWRRWSRREATEER